MSDKKQPAQQRVNVRIVKADDPEQRSGMKPIAKADGSLKSRRRRRTRQAFGQSHRLTSEGFPRWWTKAPYFPQCIRAYKSNIAGFGIDIRYKDDFADADETPEIESGMGPGGGGRRDARTWSRRATSSSRTWWRSGQPYGCAYAEVIRDMRRERRTARVSIEDTPSVEKSRRLDPRVEVTYLPPGPHREPHEEVPQV